MEAISVLTIGSIEGKEDAKDWKKKEVRVEVKTSESYGERLSEICIRNNPLIRSA